jgi:hypothetical protein
MEEDKIIDFMKKKGIKNPEFPSDKEKLKILGMIYKSKDETEQQFFKSYFTSVQAVGTAVFDGLKHLANAHVSKDYIDSVNKVIDQLNKDYDKAATEEAKEKIYFRIIEQLDRIKQESKDHRNFLKQIGLYGIGTSVLLFGVGVAVKNKELGKVMIEKGLKAFRENK